MSLKVDRCNFFLFIPLILQMEDGNLEHASTENQNLWLQDLYDQVDETVILKPSNFVTLVDSGESDHKYLPRNY